MTEPMTSDQFQQLIGKKRLKHKFNAKATEIDGKRFPSKAEAKYYHHLKTLQKAGEVLFFLRQVPFELPGNIVYRLDYLVFYADGSVRCIDIKGYETPEFKLKHRLLEETYPITLEIIK